MKNILNLFSSVGFALLSMHIEASAQQQQYVLPLSEEVILTKSMSTNSQPNGGLFEIIDLTGDSVLGYMPSSDISNDRIAIYAPLHKQEWLNLLTANGVEKSLKIGYSTLFVVNNLTVGGNEKESYGRIKGSVYESILGKNTYTKVKSVDDFFINRSSGLSKVGESISNLIIGTLASATGGIIVPISVKPQSKADVLKAENESLQFIGNGIFPSGIYKDFQEFKQLKPAYEQFYIKVDAEKKTVQVNGFSIGDSTMHPVNNAFAIAVGNELYLCRDNRLYPVEARGNNLYLSKYIDPITRKNQARFWSMNLGSQITGNYGNPFDNVYAIKIENFKGQRLNAEVTKVNSDTGQLEL